MPRRAGSSAFAALDATAFQATVEALEAYARLAFARRWITVAEGSAATGQDRLRGEYAEVLAKVKSTAQRYTGWEGLQWLAAQAAKEAGDWASALEFYGSLKRLAEVSANDPLLSRLTIAIQDAERRLAEQQAVIVAAARGEVPTSERKLTASVATGEAARRVLEAIGLTAPGTAAGVTIGILGAAPWDEAIANSPVEVLDGDMPTEAPNDLRDYQTTVWQAVRLVAPDAAFVFSPIPGGSTYAQTSALLIALKRLLDRRPDIVLVTFGSPRADPAIDAVIREAAPRALLVLAAGNEGGLSGYAGLADVAAVTSATGPAGAPAPFSSRAMPAIWAPGTDIPIISSATGRQDLRSGTTYAAAIASGAAALLRREHPQATAAQLREALLATSRPAEGRQEPAIINVPDAQSRLAAGG